MIFVSNFEKIEPHSDPTARNLCCSSIASVPLGSSNCHPKSTVEVAAAKLGGSGS